MAQPRQNYRRWEQDALRRGDAHDLEARRLTRVVGRAVRRVRAEKGLSQSQLAYRARCDRNTISALENASGDVPSLRLVTSLAVGLGVEPRLLFGDPGVLQGLDDFVRSAEGVLEDATTDSDLLRFLFDHVREVELGWGCDGPLHRVRNRQDLIRAYEIERRLKERRSQQ